MRLRYDSVADAAYIEVNGPLAQGQATQQIHSIYTPGGRGEVIPDFDLAGQLLGVEVLLASSVIAPEVLARAATSDGTQQ